MAKKDKSSSSGMAGIREKLKKVSLGLKRDTTPPPRRTKGNQNSPKSKKHTRRIPLNCLNADKKHNDEASQVDMVDIHPRIMSRHSSKNKSTKTKPSSIPSRNNNNSNNPATIKTDSMMTPDMLEVLGLTELHSEYQYRHERPSRTGTVTATATNGAAARSLSTTVVIQPSSPSIRRASPPQSDNQMQQTNSKSVRCNEIRSRHYFVQDAETKVSSSSSVSTSSTCSSNDDSYEPVPIDPCDTCEPFNPCHQDDWAFGTESDSPNNGYLQYYYRDTECADPMNCASMVLTMPVACTLLCVDNVLDTKLFEQGYGTNKNDPPTDSHDDKPEILTIQDLKRTKPRRHNTKARSSPIACL